MKVDMIVRNVVSQPVAVDAKVDGEEMRAMADGLEVELETVVPRHGNLTLRFAGKELAEARELFKRDAVVSFMAAAGKSK